ncbi:MAG TPA: hypothetical protein VMS12_08645 [Thermoanaerobaculia bacterium]|nr:hypothetical protein [Thermoanaerobaculia bacterium]
MIKKKLLFVLVLIAATALIAVAQQPPAPAPGRSPDETLQQDLQEILEDPDAADSYRYDQQGRRDPFRSLVGPAPQLSRENAPPGAAGFLIEELDLTGVVRTREGFVAMVNGPDNNGYLIKVGDKVFDGEVIRITPLSVVFRQEVNDPTRIERFREVVKDITPQSEANRR